MATAAGNIVRDAAFGKRLNDACDASFHCPDKHKGRLTWIVDQYQKRFGEKISVESVRRWSEGEVKPRKERCDNLAILLDVDATYLYLGVTPELSVRQQKARNAEVDGAVNLVAGFIQMDGGHPSFPTETDKRAKREHIDLYAIIRGANYSIHVSLGYEQGGEWRFALPKQEEMPIVLGVVRDGFNVRIVEITAEMIAERGGGNAGAVVVGMDDATLDAAKLDSFKNRL